MRSRRGTDVFFNAEDNLTGVIVNVACPSQVVELKKLISADYIGAARRKIKERLGKNVFVLPQISAAGDQSPRDLIRRKMKAQCSNLKALRNWVTA